jgi:hypothetical protein
MRILRHLGYALAAVGLLFSGLGFASVELPRYTATAYLLAHTGHQGHAYAKYQVEQTYMAGKQLQRTNPGNGLVKHSHGYLQLSADRSASAAVGSTVQLT